MVITLTQLYGNKIICNNRFLHNLTKGQGYVVQKDYSGELVIYDDVGSPRILSNIWTEFLVEDTSGAIVRLDSNTTPNITKEEVKDTWSDGTLIDREVYPLYNGERYNNI